MPAFRPKLPRSPVGIIHGFVVLKEKNLIYANLSVIIGAIDYRILKGGECTW